MKEGLLMRLLFCKIHCPFICFCKPSAAHIYTTSPSPLKLEEKNNNTVQNKLVVVTGAVAAVADASESDSSSSAGEKEDQVNGLRLDGNGDVLKSCMRKIHCESDEKKRVKWMDNLGKQLVEIKEFESSESGDTDDEEGGGRCLCLIL